MTVWEFWQEVFIAAVRSGKSASEASNTADMAVKFFNKSFPQVGGTNVGTTS